MNVKFSTAYSYPRPIRLPEAIRQWAWDSLHGKYGDDAMSRPGISVDDIEGFDSMSTIDKYDAALRAIVEKVPVRICKQELVCGSANLGLAMRCYLPVLRNGKEVLGGVSHLTLDFEKGVKYGFGRYLSEIEQRLKEDVTDEQKRVLLSYKNVLDCAEILRERYAKEAQRLGRGDLCELLKSVPFEAPQTFHQAVGNMWFMFSFTRLMGVWPGIGRIDQILGGYLKADLKAGRITLERAREILASMFIKGCEWIQTDNHTRGSGGDAQFYQNILLAGVDENGNEVTNQVTYLVLDILEELPIADFPVSVRLNSKTPKKLLEKMARVIRHGGGVVAMYDEDQVIQSMVNTGKFTLRQARRFANDGCWEVQIPGATDFSYMPFDALQLFNSAVCLSEGEIPDCQNIDEVFELFAQKLDQKVKDLYYGCTTGCYELRDGEWRRKDKDFNPLSAASVFEDGCIPTGRTYTDQGIRFFERSPHIGGAPDVANSLYAIQKLVFEQHKCTFKQLIMLLRDNWEGDEQLRLYAKNKFVYYGNDNDECDMYLAKILDRFADSVEKCSKINPDFPVIFIPGVSTFGRQVDWLPQRCAVAFGLKKGEILSGNTSPTPGTDAAGATAIIKSYCKTPLNRMTCGAALDIKIFPETLKGTNGLNALAELMRGFVRLNGFFMQIDTVDAKTLLAARDNPQQYKTLSVRVSGWNARFVTLSKEWQDMIIQRTTQDI